MTDDFSVPALDPDDDPDDLMAARRRRPTWIKVGAVIMLFAALALAVAVVARGGGPDPTSDAVAHGGDLGSHSDPMALSEQLGPELGGDGAGPDAGTGPPESVPCGDSEAALPADRAQLVYSATLDWEGTPAVVLGYRLEGDGLSRVLLVMAEDDCHLIVTQSF